jgi:hypothetical protein
MLAIQSVTIEEHEMRDLRAVQRFVHAEHPLHRRGRAAFGTRVQGAHANGARGSFDASLLQRSFGALSSATSFAVTF